MSDRIRKVTFLCLFIPVWMLLAVAMLYASYRCVTSDKGQNPEDTIILIASCTLLGVGWIMWFLVFTAAITIPE